MALAPYEELACKLVDLAAAVRADVNTPEMVSARLRQIDQQFTDAINQHIALAQAGSAEGLEQVREDAAP